MLALILLIRAGNIMDKPGRKKYMETMFPLYRLIEILLFRSVQSSALVFMKLTSVLRVQRFLCSLFGFIVLHILMYAANIYFWRRYRVNYSFIFGFEQGTELGYRQVLLVSFVIAALAIGAVLANLDMELDPNTKDYKALTELVPLFLLVVKLFGTC